MERNKLTLPSVGRLLLLFLFGLVAAGAVAGDVLSASDFELKTPPAYAKSNFTLEDARRLLRQKCMKALTNRDAGNATEAHDRLEKAFGRLLDCANNLANMTQILDEIEQARPLGDLDVVFEKYCDRMPQAEHCLAEFNAALLPCLTAVERAQNAVMLHIVRGVLGYICHKRGDQIAFFIAEQGPECLEEQKEHITNCMNATFSAYLPKPDEQTPLAVSELPELVLGPKQCIDLHDFEECVVTYLERCNEITPANIVESLFRYVRKESKCQPAIDRQLEVRRNAMAAAGNFTQQRNGQTRALASWRMLFTFMGALLLAKRRQQISWRRH